MAADGVNANSRINDVYKMDLSDEKALNLKDGQQVASIYNLLNTEASELRSNPDIDGNGEVNEEDFKAGNYETCISKMQSLASTIKNYASSITSKKYEHLKQAYMSYAKNLENNINSLNKLMNTALDRTKPSFYNYSNDEKVLVEKYSKEIPELETEAEALLANPDASVEDLQAMRNRLMSKRDEINSLSKEDFTKFSKYCSSISYELSTMAVNQFDEKIKELEEPNGTDSDDLPKRMPWNLPAQQEAMEIYEGFASPKGSTELRNKKLFNSPNYRIG